MAVLLQKQLQAERELYPSSLLQLLNLGNFILTFHRRKRLPQWQGFEQADPSMSELCRSCWRGTRDRTTFMDRAQEKGIVPSWKELPCTSCTTSAGQSQGSAHPIQQSMERLEEGGGLAATARPGEQGLGCWGSPARVWRSSWAVGHGSRAAAANRAGGKAQQCQERVFIRADHNMHFPLLKPSQGLPLSLPGTCPEWSMCPAGGREGIA